MVVDNQILKMALDINLIKKLRDATMAPLKDVKEALEQNDGDFEKSVAFLKKKWVSQLAKKWDRDTNEWVVRVRQYGDKFVWVQIGCETDFVAKNEAFVELSWKVADVIWNSSQNDINSAADLNEENKAAIDTLLQEYIMKLGENMRLVDAFAKNGQGYAYEHPWNKIAAVMFYDGDEDHSLAKEVTLQIASMNPQYLSRDHMPSEEIEKLRAEYMKEADDGKKPKDIVEKIVEWRLAKELWDYVLLEQAYIKDSSKTINHLVGDKIKVKHYKRFAI